MISVSVLVLRDRVHVDYYEIFCETCSCSSLSLMDYLLPSCFHELMKRSFFAVNSGSLLSIPVTSSCSFEFVVLSFSHKTAKLKKEVAFNMMETGRQIIINTYTGIAKNSVKACTFLYLVGFKELCS